MMRKEAKEINGNGWRRIKNLRKSKDPFQLLVFLNHNTVLKLHNSINGTARIQFFIYRIKSQTTNAFDFPKQEVNGNRCDLKSNDHCTKFHKVQK